MRLFGIELSDRDRSLIGKQVMAGHAMLGWRHEQLARLRGLTSRPVYAVEAGEQCLLETVIRVTQALRACDLQLTERGVELCRDAPAC